MYYDKTLSCKKCGKQFFLTAGEHESMVGLGIHQLPENCKSCNNEKEIDYSPRKLVCEKCNKSATVTYKQEVTRPNYCFDCYEKDGFAN